MITIRGLTVEAAGAMGVMRVTGVTGVTEADGSQEQNNMVIGQEIVQCFENFSTIYRFFLAYNNKTILDLKSLLLILESPDLCTILLLMKYITNEFIIHFN